MGTITNIINTLFTSSGADSTRRDTERLARAQTRLGQASASNGRQFAAQASGLGGLVAAYAGAAANVFALTAAFTALSAAARSIQTLEGLTALGAQSGVQGQELLQSITQITRGQLSLVEAAQQINLSLSAGFSTEQIEGLGDVALRASRALGRDLSDSFTRVVRGSAKLETELLDELGIYTKIEPATRAYALALGVSVSSLTEFQRRQAFVNSVIEEGSRKFAAINVTVPTASEQIEAFGKTIVNIITQIGGFIANILAPLADFLTNNLAASFGTVAALGALSFAKLFSVLRDGVGNAEARLAAFNDRVQESIINSRALARTKQSFAAAQTALQGISLAPGGTSGIRAELKALKQLSAQQQLNTTQLRDAADILRKRQANLEANRRTLVQSIVAERANRAAAAAGSAERAAAIASLQRLNRSLVSNNALLTSNTAQLAAVTTAVNTAGAGFARFAGAVIGAASAIGIATARIATAAIGFGGFLIGAIAIVGIFATAIANLTGQADALNARFREIGTTLSAAFGGARIRELSNVTQGLAAASLERLEETDVELRNLDSFSFRRKFLGVDVTITKTREEIIQEVGDLLAQVAADPGLGTGGRVVRSIGATLGSAVIGGLLTGGLPGALAGGLIGLVGSIFVNQSESLPIEAVSQEIRDRFLSQLEGVPARSRDIALRSLEALERELGAAAEVDSGARLLLETQSELVIQSAAFLDNMEAIASIMRATGQSSAQIVENFDFDPTNALRALTEIRNVQFSIEFADRNAISERITDLIRSTQEQAVTELANSQSLNQLLTTALSEGIDIASVRIQAANTGTEFSVALAAAIEQATTDINLGSLLNSFTDSGQAVDRLNRSLVVSAEVLRTLDSGIRTNSISFEQYEQQIGAIDSALIDANSAAVSASSTISSLESILSSIALPQDVRDELEAIVVEENRRLAAALAAVKAQEAIAAALRSQREEYRAISTISSFISGITPQDTNILQRELDLFSAGEDNTRVIQLQFLDEIIASTEEAVRAQESLRNSFSDFDLPDNVLQTILTSIAGEEQQVLEALQTIEGLSASLDSAGNVIGIAQNDAARWFTLLSREAQVSAEQGVAALQAYERILGDEIVAAAGAARQAISSYNNIVAESAEAIRQLEDTERIATIRFNLDTESLQRDIELLVQEGILEQLELQIELTAAREGSGAITAAQAAQEENRLQQEVLAQRRLIIQLELESALAALAGRREILEAEAENTRLDIAAREAQQLAEIAAFRQQLTSLSDLYSTFISAQDQVNGALINDFSAAGQNVSTALAQTLESGAAALNAAIVSGLEGEFGISPVAAGQVETVAREEGIAALSEGFNNILAQFDIAATAAEVAIRERSIAEQEANETALRRALDLIDLETAAENQRALNRLANLETERQIETENAAQRIAEAEEVGAAAEEASSALRDSLLRIYDGIAGSFKDAFMRLNDLIFYGEGTIGDVIGGLLRGIQTTLFEELVARPLSDFITENIFSGIFGIQGGRRGIENARVTATGALLVTMEDGFFGPNGGGMFGLRDGRAIQGIKDQTVGFMNSIFGQQGTVPNLFSNLFGEGGFLVNLISGFGNFFGGIFRSIFGGGGGLFGGLFGGGLGLKAAGGIMHLAQGGSPSPSAIRRDRIPALLEPGEFVIRKPMARTIGTPALQSLNATGQMPTSAPIINFKNEGTPKEAEASAPRFDGEKFVIDIIMRDISNNGPIRRTLRAGS